MNGEILYGIFDREYLHDDPDEAIEELLDDCDASDFAAMAPLEVREYKRAKATLDPEEVLEWVLEKLDQDFSVAAEEETHPTQKMKDAAREFCAAILADYVPYDCFPTGKVEIVNALDWVRENCPCWLEAAR